MLAVVAGIVTTVAVAWVAMFLPSGHAWHGPPTTQVMGAAKDSKDRIWQLSRGHNAWHDVVGYWHMQMSGMSLWMPEDDFEAMRVDLESLPRRERPDDLADLVMNSWYHTTGWPFPAMTCSVHWVRQIANANVLYEVQDGVQLPRDADFNPRALPMRPVWPGFLGNVVVYGGLWWLGLAGVGLLRARRRARRGLCGGCGYPRADLPGGSPCPECGKLPVEGQ